MTVKELIKFLKTQDPKMLVAYRMYSEQCLLQESDIYVQDLCVARPDGWIQNKRPDMPTVRYLVFPGN